MKKYILLIAVLVAVLGIGTVKADDLSGLRARAEQGDADAQVSLAKAYWIGEGIEKDRSKAIALWRKAAKQGDALAQGVLGTIYMHGESIDIDQRQAVYWLSKSAKQGLARAQNSLGYAYDKGEGVDQDYRQAVQWYRKAASQGFALAQFNLGLAYWRGNGVDKDLRKAADWYRKAAEQGDVRAQYYLGSAYEDGEGVVQNQRQAVHWYRKAAEQGHEYWNSSAQFKLGYAYSSGKGVIQDYREAYIWYLIAKANGYLLAEWIVDDYSFLSASEMLSAQDEATRRYDAIENSTYESIEQNNFPNIPDIAKPPATANIAQQVFENTWRSVVVIETKDAQGSGVIVRPNIVATNCHVVDNAKRIAVYKSVARRADDDNAFAARIRHADKRRDFCLLDVDGLWGIAATVRKYATLKVGESVYGLGAPKGLDLSLADGLISQLREIDGNRKIQTNVAISPGSSGGGLFDREGNLIGIMTSKITDESVEGIGFAIPADLVLRE